MESVCLETEIVRNLPIGLLCWYGFEKGSKILWIKEKENTKFDRIPEYLQKHGYGIEVCEMDSTSIPEWTGYGYEYVILIELLEKHQNQKSVLEFCKSVMAEHGTLLLGMNNAYGLRYFCGDRDPYTDRNFDSIEQYRRISERDRENLSGKMLGRAAVEKLLERTGFIDFRTFSVMPSLECPQIIYRQDCLPNENLAERYFPMYGHPDTVFLEEEYLYGNLAENGLFHSLANSFLFECSLDKAYDATMHATISLNRDKDKALATIIKENDVVEKIAIFEDGKQTLQRLKINMDTLRSRGIKTVWVEEHNEKITMPYLKGVVASQYFMQLIDRVDRDVFIQKVDAFKQLILQSSDLIRDEESGEVLLKEGYPDLALLNCVVVEDEFVLIDQEFMEENLPVKVLLMRLVDDLYSSNLKLESVIPRSFFEERYGLTEKRDQWRAYLWKFGTKLRNEDILGSYLEAHRRNLEVVHTNRQRMNYSYNEFQRLFVDIFDDLDGKKIFLFGSGAFAKKFLALYHSEYEIAGILDNAKDRWGQLLDGVPIISPQQLQDLDGNTYKVIICIKNYTGVLKQIENLGVKKFSVYDPNMEYPRRTRLVCGGQPENQERKLYQVGYIAGVFDLFHIGHLNLLRRAKEMCDYLIVGVVTDEGVRINKRVEPYVPFAERIEMIRACKYVDETVEIPFGYAGTRDAFRKYHFDVQFSGSDYETDPNWLQEKSFLEKHGASMVFFPYTQGTSSTMLKAAIDKQIEKE